jgi:hypothetical protein
MMSQSWLERVNSYLDSLAQCVEDLNEALDETRVGTTTLDTPKIGNGTEQLSACLKDLERLIADRQQLIDADDAPLRGVSLRDILNRCVLTDAPSVAARCKQLSRDVDLSRERAVALFVCQFHLGDLSTHLLALLRSGADHGATYQRGKTDLKRNEGGGSVFNKAA